MKEQHFDQQNWVSILIKTRLKLAKKNMNEKDGKLYRKQIIEKFRAEIRIVDQKYVFKNFHISKCHIWVVQSL